MNRRNFIAGALGMLGLGRLAKAKPPPKVVTLPSPQWKILNAWKPGPMTITLPDVNKPNGFLLLSGGGDKWEIVARDTIEADWEII